MRLDASGNLSINTTSSNYRLGVNGDVGISNSNKLYIGGVGADSVIGSLGNVSGVFTLKSDGNRDISIGSDTEAIFIEGSNGDVGIGTSTPQLPLHIEGATGSQILITGASDSVGTTAGILLRAEAGEDNGLARVKGAIFFERRAGTYGNGSLKFAVNTSGNNDTVTVADTKMTIDDAGNTNIENPTGASQLSYGLRFNKTNSSSLQQVGSEILSSPACT